MISSKTSTLYLSPPRSDLWLALSLRLLAASGIALLAIIVWCLLAEAWNVLVGVGVWHFLTDASWHPTEGTFGLAPMAVASIASAAGSVLVAGPIGIGCAVFCKYYCSPMWSGAFRQLLALFAGIPSVVFGFWGLVTLVPLIADNNPPGASLLAGTLVLAMMILPTVALTSHAALASVPNSFLSAGHALGLRRGTIVLKVALVAARSGILAGIIMALGRALGETMAMLMVSGNIVQVPSSVFDSVRSLAANIALEMAYATGTHRSALYACGIALIVVVAVSTLIADRLTAGGRPRG
jgi:phosphate transport system permease protein